MKSSSTPSDSPPSDSPPSDPHTDTVIAEITTEISKKSTPYGIAWRAASQSEVNDMEINNFDIEKNCRRINDTPSSGLTIMPKSILLAGVSEILRRKVDIVSEEGQRLKEELQKLKGSTSSQSTDVILERANQPEDSVSQRSPNASVIQERPSRKKPTQASTSNESRRPGLRPRKGQTQASTTNADRTTSLARPRYKRKKTDFILPATCLEEATYNAVSLTPRMTYLVKSFRGRLGNLAKSTCKKVTCELNAWHKEHKDSRRNTASTPVDAEGAGSVPPITADEEQGNQDQGGGGPDFISGFDDNGGGGSDFNHNGGGGFDFNDNGGLDDQATASSSRDEAVESTKELLKQKFDSNTDSGELNFTDLTEGCGTKEAVTLLIHICVLASARFIQVKQTGMCGDITIKKGDNFE